MNHKAINTTIPTYGTASSSFRRLMSRIISFTAEKLSIKSLESFNSDDPKAIRTACKMLTSKATEIIYSAYLSGGGDSGDVTDEYMVINGEKTDVSMEPFGIASWDWYNNEGGTVEIGIDIISGNVNVEGCYYTYEEIPQSEPSINLYE